MNHTLDMTPSALDAPRLRQRLLLSVLSFALCGTSVSWTTVTAAGPSASQTHATKPGKAAKAANVAAKPATRPNILLIVADDLGFSDIGAFGGEIETPNLDALAAEGLRLTDFHSAATCSPTRAMLMSGVDHHIAGVGSMAELMVPEQQGQPGYEGYLNDRVAALPALLRQDGYRTYMAGKWHLGLSEELSPAARGFEKSFALLRGADDHVAQPWNTTINPTNPYYREDGKLATVPADFYSSDFYADKLISYLKAGQGDERPFMAYLAFTAPHWPLQAPEQVIAKYEQRYEAGYEPIRAARIARQKTLGLIPQNYYAAPARNLWPQWRRLTPAKQKQEARRMAIYAAMVDVMDQNIGKVIRQLKASGQYDNTVIIFMSDNGAEGQDTASRFNDIPRDNSLANLGKPSSYAAYGPNWAQISALPFNLFKGYTHEGGITVPAIVRYPARLGGGQVSAVPGHVTDIAPTLLALAGVRAPAKVDGREVAPIQGRSMLPWLNGQEAQVHPVFDVGWELFGRRAYRQNEWKIVYAPPPLGTGRWQLFNLNNDRAEQQDLALHHPNKLVELQAAYVQYAKRVGVIEAPGLSERIAERYDNKNYFQNLQ